MKHLKKISALILSALMVMSMSASVFAATNVKEPDEVGDATNAEFETDSTTFSIPKGIIVTNVENITVYSPTIEYTFTIAPDANVNTTVKSTVLNKEGTLKIKPGVADGVVITNTDGKVKFEADVTPDKVGSLGIELTKNINFSVDLTKWNGDPKIGAGVYRYVITDTTNTDALTAAGITRETDYTATRYLDLYLQNDGTTGNVKVAGYTIVNGDQGATELNGDTNDTTAKNEGFVSGSTKNGNGVISERGTIPCDLYNTINVRLDKTVAGAMGDKQHPFPFAVDLADKGTYFYTTTDTTADVQGAKTNETSLTQALKHGETFIIKGLNPKATVKYTETNDTPDKYKVEANVALTGPDASTKEVAPGGTAYTADLKVSNYATYATQNIVVDATNEDITYTNTLNQISPTNVVMRFAPYLFILGGAIMLLFASRRRRSEQE